MADLTTGTNQGICSVRKLGSQWVQPRTLSYNPAERSVLVTSVSFPTCPESVHGADDPGSGQWTVRARTPSQGYWCDCFGRQGCSFGRKEGFWIQCDLCCSKSTSGTRQGRSGMSSLPGYLVHGADDQNIETRDLSNNIIKTVKCPVQTNDIFYGGTASLILSSTASVALFDIQQQKVLAELTTPPVKYVVCSTDGNNVALLSKHSGSALVFDGYRTDK